MEKVGGKRSCRNLGGSALIINALSQVSAKTLREGIQHDGHNLMFHFLKSF